MIFARVEIIDIFGGRPIAVNTMPEIMHLSASSDKTHIIMNSQVILNMCIRLASGKGAKRDDYYEKRTGNLWKSPYYLHFTTYYFLHQTSLSYANWLSGLKASAKYEEFVLRTNPRYSSEGGFIVDSATLVTRMIRSTFHHNYGICWVKKGL